jgi:hypothetical protein
MKPAKLLQAQLRIDAGRADMDAILTEMLKALTLEVAAEYPGHTVTGLSAMGTWGVRVDDVPFNEDYEELSREDIDDETCFCEVHYVGYPMEGGYTERSHDTLKAFDDAWTDYQTYPTVRFDVDKAGNLTSRVDW